MKPGGEMILPRANRGKQGVNRVMYLLDGLDGVKIDGEVVGEKVCITLDSTRDVSLELPRGARDTTEFLVLQGRPIKEPVVQHGPFVMNTEEEIRQAFYDYSKTRFGGWPWKREDMIFPQNKGRFTLVDGRDSFPGDSIHKDDVEDETKISNEEL